MNIKTYLLKKEALKILDLAIINDYDTIDKILSLQKNANILSIGFDFLYEKKISKYDSNWQDSNEKKINYEANLLESLISNDRFHYVLEMAFSKNMIVDDLKEKIKIIEEKDDVLSLHKFLGMCNNHSKLKKMVMKSLLLKSEDLDLLDESKIKKNKTKKGILI